MLGRVLLNPLVVASVLGALMNASMAAYPWSLPTCITDMLETISKVAALALLERFAVSSAQAAVREGGGAQ